MQKLEVQFDGIPADTPDVEIMEWIESDKIPEAIMKAKEEAAALRLARKSNRRALPMSAESSHQPRQAQNTPEKSSGSEKPLAAIDVVCGPVIGTLRVWGTTRDTIDVLCDNTTYSLRQLEEVGGMAHAKKPMRSIAIIDANGVPTTTLDKWWMEFTKQSKGQGCKKRGRSS